MEKLTIVCGFGSLALVFGLLGVSNLFYNRFVTLVNASGLGKKMKVEDVKDKPTFINIAASILNIGLALIFAFLSVRFFIIL